jgi:ABC-type Na+ efflux pump permease subunit
MKYAIETGSGIQKLMGGGMHRHTESMVICKPTFIFQNKESRIKVMMMMMMMMIIIIIIIIMTIVIIILIILIELGHFTAYSGLNCRIP